MVFCILYTLTAYAHDLLKPTWRGQAATTYQHWRFDSNSNPAAPELINNPYGQAIATITIGEFGEGWLHDIGFSEQTGIWDLGREGTILLEVDNADMPGQFKEIWVQVTYFKAFWSAPDVNVPGANYRGGQTVLVEDTGMGGAWYLNRSKWRLETTSDSEEAIIIAGWYGSQIDQVVVDTILLSADCIVDFNDLAWFCDQWLQPAGPDPNTDADLDDSNHVDFKDYNILASDWFDICPPDWPFK